MSIRRTAIALAFAALLPAGSLAAQGSSAETALFPSESGAASSAALEARFERAQQLRFAGRFSEARREYVAIARLQQKRGEFAGQSLWNLAEIQHASGDIERAASTLDKVVLEAQRFGHPDLQARALVEAAVLYQRLKDADSALARLNQLEPLLSSPFLSPEIRDNIQRRIRA